MELTQLATTVQQINRQVASLRWRQAHGDDVEAALNAADAALGETYAGFAADHRSDLRPDRLTTGDRRLEIHKCAALRAAVEQERDVSALRNRLDIRSDYLAAVGPRPPVVATDPDPARREELWQWRNELGRLMKADLLALMRRRNELARGLGYPDYPTLMLAARETSPGSLASFINGLGGSTERPYRSMLAALAEPPLARDEALLPELLSEAVGYSSTGSAHHAVSHADAVAGVRNNFARLGVELSADRVEALVAEQDLAVGCTLATDPPREAKVVLTPVPLHDFGPLAHHEFGHAAHYLNLPADPTLGLIDPGFDEAIATYFEGLSGWSEGRAAQLDGGPPELAELRRLIASHLFELAAYSDLDGDLDSVYAQYQVAIRGIDTPPSPIWAIDSFRAVDPMYIQYYIMARSAAAAMRRYSYRTYGSLYCREYAVAVTAACRDGMSESWLTRLTQLTNPA